MRDRPKPALTCRQCRFYNRCMESNTKSVLFEDLDPKSPTFGRVYVNRMRPCRNFQHRKEDMGTLDWLVVGALIIGTYVGLIIGSIVMA